MDLTFPAIFLTPLASNFEALHVNVMFAKRSLGHAFTANTCTESICQAGY